MQIKKEILLFYILVLVSAGVIVGAENPGFHQTNPILPTKCSKLPKPNPSVSPFHSITEGILRYKA